MFKLFAVVFAAILALAVAAPKPSSLIAPAPLLTTNPIAYSAYQAPLTYASAYSAPLTTYNAYAYPGAYAAPSIAYY